ncbi:MAG: MFS transporter [Candidatus Dormibacteraeota bacterium]|nr:MFS transporter [Candidatus Dormibacteraeota bacterium]
MSSAPPRVSLGRQLTLAVFWFGISFVWGALLSVALPFILVPEHAGAGNPALVPAAGKNTAISLLETGGLLIAILVQPAAGAFSDTLRTRWGRRRPLIAVGALGAAASLLLVAGAQSFALLVAAYCLLQLFMNIAQGAYQGLLPDTVSGAQRGAASGWLGIATLSGQVAGVVVAGPLAARTACYVIAAVLFASALLTVTRIPEDPASAQQRVTSAASVTQRLRAYAAEFARYPDFCWVVFSRFLIFTSLACVQRFAAYYIADTFHGHYALFGIDLGSAQTATSAMLAVVILFGIAVTYPAVRLSDRAGRRAILVSAALLGALACALFTIAGTVTEVVLFALPMALCFGMVVSVDWAFMTDLAPRRRAGKFLGFSNLATAGAQAAAPTFLGPVIDVVNAHTRTANGSSGTGGYRVMFTVGAACFVLGALALRRVRARRVADVDDEPAGVPRLALT